ncbi:MAG TPA: acyl-ACP thioesterase domain-containing protein, partial [Desulfotignum sp.]|nr:acyl-ACP thioesterase domain-containing protein [Desulfotignum sp.]
MKRESVFSQKMMLPFSAMGANNHVRMDRILGLFQDAAGLHAHELGISGFDLAGKNLKWVISRYQICVHDTLEWPRPFELRTWRHPWKNLYELRRFDMVDADGRSLISALGIWVMVKA